ncbi:hypothetical protein LV457_11425 [Mycobacterium sp. MYCO198283]|uniref:hypothetical protein n=1 Tax=Mycobacterium sp. MYCO198283 TaxID=2883505 RepID=UPI001E4AC1B1|nr:hypothetical protein [Mycobacterium sp. MYCO198283]MCG5432893.1 hypothetical protein [Mycobacterium sp. MYCO198283]
MRRTVAIGWHAVFSVAAGVLYFFFVLPRWQELLGSVSHTTGTVLRIVVAALVGLAALPVVFTLLRTRKPEYGAPQLALTLRTLSIAGHVLAAVIILGTAISEIWLSVDDYGRWLFGLYGAAAAIAVLAMFAFYLSFLAELPPPPPKPIKGKKKRKRRRRSKGDDAFAAADADEPDAENADEPDAESADDTVQEPVADASGTAAAAEPESGAAEPAADEPTTLVDEVKASGDEVKVDDEVVATADDELPAATDTTAAEAPRAGGLKNRRPSGKAGGIRRRRTRGGVATEDGKEG